MTDKAWKALGLCLACGSAVWLGTVSAQAAKPENCRNAGSSIAGIGVAMEEHHRSRAAGLTQEEMMYGTFQDVFDNLGVAMVEDSLNIRKEPKSDSDITGKMESHAGCSVLGMEHGWYKIKSGQVTGYVSGRYLAVGQAARAVAFHDMKLRLRVGTDTLRVRSGPNTESEILGRIYEGETYDFISMNDSGWAKINYNGTTGYAFVPGNGIVAYTIPEAEKVEDSLRRRVVDYAVKFVGNPYRWGGTNPNTGADCSGFVQYVMEHAAGIHIDRTSREQAADGEAVPASAMMPGDLLFYAGGSTIDHVALYIGDGKIVHAANRRSGIKISSWNYRQPVTIRRVIP